MDLVAILSLFLSTAAIAVSIITFWLAKFQGPNITLLNSPIFKTSDQSFKRRYSAPQDYTPRWFEMNPISFVFANYGGKSGSILDLELNFIPNDDFKTFFAGFYSNSNRYEGDLSPPVVIDEGDNQILTLSPEIYTINWKRNTLAEVLERGTKVNDLVSKALDRSREKFREFCDFLDQFEELGLVTCTVTLTKGRFSTKVKEEVILKDIVVSNSYDESVPFLRECLSRWEHLRDTRVDLRNILVRDVENLIRELENNSSILKTPLKEYDVSHKGSAIKLKIDDWKRLTQARNSEERKIRWFLIKSKEGLETDLKRTYNEIIEYNNAYDELMSLGDLRTNAAFDEINKRRNKISSALKEILTRLTELHRQTA